MAITPQTNLKLLKVPIEIDLKNQLTFTSLENPRRIPSEFSVICIG